ncbi:hypothetical protein L6272_05195, partial [Microgenomates group bacterium]|nr:hypothetical protein [Microgenomates group bacterium]
MKKLLIISTSKEFCNDWVNKLSKQFKVTWGQHDLISEEKLLSVLNTDSWDILAISPDPLKWEIPESFYSSLGKIKHVCLPTTSYECFDAKRLKKMGIALSNIPHYSTNAVAEWALFMMLGLLRRISSVIKADFNHKYTDENLAAEFEGKTAGIIG